MQNKNITEATYVNIADRKQGEKKRSKKTQRIVSSVVVLFVAAFLVMGGARLVSANTNAYVISVDGKDVVTLVSESEANSAIDECLSARAEEYAADYQLGISYTNNVEIKKISAVGVVFSSVNDAAVVLADNLHMVADAVVLMVDNQKTLYVANETDAIQAVNLAKSHYGDASDENVLKVYTREQISMSGATVECNQVLTAEEAANMLIYGSTKEIEAAKPKITVVVERTATEIAPLEYKTIRIDDSSMARGEEEVVTEGVDGTQELTLKLTEVNGVVASSEQLDSLVLTEAVDEVVNVGTKLIISSRSVNAIASGNGEFGWPLSGGVGIVSSRFGWRSRGWHSGVDLAADMYTVICAAEAGTVSFADYQSGYGLLVIIDHGNGVTTYYAHCDEVFVGVGDSVERGSAISTIGMTGTTTGPHVHFEIRSDGNAIDPLPYIE